MKSLRNMPSKLLARYTLKWEYDSNIVPCSNTCLSTPVQQNASTIQQYNSPPLHVSPCSTKSGWLKQSTTILKSIKTRPAPIDGCGHRHPLWTKLVLTKIVVTRVFPPPLIQCFSYVTFSPPTAFMTASKSAAVVCNAPPAAATGRFCPPPAPTPAKKRESEYIGHIGLCVKWK